MTGCDPNAVTIILGFSVGGLTLKYVIGWLKDVLRAKGFLAQALSVAMCFAAAAVYILFTKGNWSCLLPYGSEIFVGTQLFYRAMKKK